MKHGWVFYSEGSRWHEPQKLLLGDTWVLVLGFRVRLGLGLGLGGDRVMVRVRVVFS